MIRSPRLALALVASLAAAPALAAPATYSIDPTHASIAFKVMHIGYAQTIGFFREIEGGFTYDAEAQELGRVEVSIPASSVWTNHERRDAHVRNADFLDVEAHPVITFTAEGGTVTGDNTGTVTGDLTILGVTKPITLEATLNKVANYPFGHQKETMGISIRGTVTRSEFGMDYAVANGLVGDDVELLIEIEAIREE